MKAQLFLTVIILLFCDSALAGESASMNCIESHVETTESGQITVCDKYELRVQVDADNDVGLPGEIIIGAASFDGNHTPYWTVDNGWKGFDGGVLIPADGYHPSLPQSSEYVVYTGTMEGLCALSQGQTFSLYAGHGILPPDKEKEVQFYESRESTKDMADQLRKAAIDQDIRINGKYSQIFTHECSTASNGN